mmetsp:Transcript_11841/g.18331  ORF Transcript_11841/g.18331 Transcript_11841/m.18331 type:complete len:243 (+) Transcript_11841:200-928(+)
MIFCIRNQQRRLYQATLYWCRKPFQRSARTSKHQTTAGSLSNAISLLGCERIRDHQFHVHRRYFSSDSAKSDRTINDQRPDPLARRPNKVCDPYGQGGKPMPLNDAQSLLTTTLEEGWKLQKVSSHRNNRDDVEEENKTNGPPESLYREFYHFDFMQASKFISHIAAVAHNNNHYPSIHLERRLRSRKGAWQVVTTVKCRTPTLQGLSHHDFHIALMVDVEIARPHVQKLLLSDEQSQRKHT